MTPHWTVRAGTWQRFSHALAWDYGWDVGTSHVIDRVLFLETSRLAAQFTPAIVTWPGHSARDADAEDFRNGDRHQ